MLHRNQPKNLVSRSPVQWVCRCFSCERQGGSAVTSEIKAAPGQSRAALLPPGPVHPTTGWTGLDLLVHSEYKSRPISWMLEKQNSFYIIFVSVNVENRRKHQVREQSAVWGCRRNLISGAAGCDDDHGFCCLWYHYYESSWALAPLLAQWEFIFIYILCRHKNVCFVMAQWQLWQQQSNTLQFCHQRMTTFLQIPEAQPGLTYSQIVTVVKEASMSNERVNTESLNYSTFKSMRKWGHYRCSLLINDVKGTEINQMDAFSLGSSEVSCLSQELLWFDTWPWLGPSP